MDNFTLAAQNGWTYPGKSIDDLFDGLSCDFDIYLYNENEDNGPVLTFHVSTSKLIDDMLWTEKVDSHSKAEDIAYEKCHKRAMAAIELVNILNQNKLKQVTF